jgi:integrase
VTVWVRKRATQEKGTRYQVVYRRGGRAFKLETAGTFPTQREARTRRDLVAGWIASGKNPKTELAILAATRTPERTYRKVAEAYKRSRIDTADETRKSVGSHLKRLLPIFGDSVPAAITVTDCIEAVAVLAEDLKPSSLGRYWATHRLILDFAGVDPNPARDKAVKLPRIEQVQKQPPSAAHFEQMLRAMPPRYWLPLITIEQTAMRVGEAESLAWGDVDEAGSRLRLRSAETKTRRPRWVQVPEWLMAVIAETCPREDRTLERRVFRGFTADVAKNAMSRACITAGIPHYSPHDLRHRRATIWHHEGVPTRVLMERGGWSSSDIAIETYSHVLPVEDVPPLTLEAMLVMSR